MSKRSFCPISEINWESEFYADQPESPGLRYWQAGKNEPDPEGELLGIELLVSQYRAAYPARDSRGDWIEKQLRAWWQGRDEG